jgi:hypothetical protein
VFVGSSMLCHYSQSPEGVASTLPNPEPAR